MDGLSQNYTPFIVLHGDVLIKKVVDDRTCLEWTIGMGYTEDQWERAIRGYISENRLQCFTGRDYRCVPYVNSEILRLLREYHGSVYGYLPTELYNGLKKGEAGIAWEPLCVLNV